MMLSQLTQGAKIPPKLTPQQLLEEGKRLLRLLDASTFTDVAQDVMESNGGDGIQWKEGDFEAFLGYFGSASDCIIPSGGGVVAGNTTAAAATAAETELTPTATEATTPTKNEEMAYSQIDSPEGASPTSPNSEMDENELLRHNQSQFRKIVVSVLTQILVPPSPNSSSASTTQSTTIMEMIHSPHYPFRGKDARRILSDGLLPLASSLPHDNKYCSNMIGDCISIILQTATITTNDEGNKLTSSSSSSHNPASEPSTMGLELLFPSYLAFLHAAEMNHDPSIPSSPSSSSSFSFKNINSINNRNRTIPFNHGTAGTVDSILDELCISPTNPSETNIQLRPTSAAAIASCIRDIDSILPNRLSTRVHFNNTTPTNNNHPSSTSNTTTTTTSTTLEQDTFNRIPSLILSLLTSFSTLLDTNDYNSIPPLVYQLSLLSCKISSSTTTTAMTSASSSMEKERCQVLIGISTLLDELLHDIMDYSPSTFNDSDANNGGGVANNTMKLDTMRWCISTCLTHLGSILRSDKGLTKVLLQIIKGEIDESEFILPSTTTSTTSTTTVGGTNGRRNSQRRRRNALNMRNTKPVFRFQRMTCFKLALGMTMACTIPRMKVTTLHCLRDAILEEELFHEKQSSSSWFRATVTMLHASRDGRDLDEDDRLALSNGGHGNMDRLTTMRDEGGVGGNHVGGDGCQANYMNRHMMKLVDLCLGWTGGDTEMNGVNSHGGSTDATFSSLLQTIVNLGFLLIDTVKKDPTSHNLTEPAGIFHFRTSPTINTSAITSQNSTTVLLQKAQASASKIGRSLLAHLFYKEGVMNMNQSGTSSFSIGRGTNGSSNSPSVSPLCRSILMTASEKFCGKAPNALEYSYLLRDIAMSNHPALVSSSCLSILDEFLPIIIDWLSNIPGGGMTPAVAIASIIPTLKVTLKHVVKQGRVNSIKRRELDDHIDNCFLLTKKVLFCADVERRRVAVQLLMVILEISIDRSVSGDGVMKVDSAILDEVKGYIRRCLTQHQMGVRLEVYTSLIALLPESFAGETNDNPLYLTVSQILSSHMERYAVVQEKGNERQARRKRGIQHGTQLSQKSCDSDDSDGLDMGPPLRLDRCIALGRISSPLMTNGEGSKKKKAKGDGGKKKKKAPGSSVMTEALGRINEPLHHLLASINTIISCEKLTAGEINQTKPLYLMMDGIRSSVSRSGLDEYISFAEESAGSKSAKDRDSKILAVCIILGSICETLMQLPDPDGKECYMTIGRLFRLRMDALDRADDIYSNYTTLNTAILPQFLSKNLSIEVTKAPDNDDDDSSGEQDESMTAKDRLTKNYKFRRFLLEQCLNLFSGKSSTIMCGKRFDSVEQLTSDAITQEVGSQCIGFAHLLMPLIFNEFCSVIQDRQHTSLANDSKISLTKLALNTCIYCIRGLMIEFASSTVGLNQKNRIVSLLERAMEKVTSTFPETKERCEFLSSNELRKGLSSSVKGEIGSLEERFLKITIPFVLPMIAYSTEAKDVKEVKGGLLSELVSHGLDEEASLFCSLITYTLHLFGPKTRLLLGAYMLRCFDQTDPGTSKEGILGLDHDSTLTSNTACASSAASCIDCCLCLDKLLDGSTTLPSFCSTNRRTWRTALGFTSFYGDERLDKSMSQPTEFHELDGDDLIGMSYRVSISFRSKLGSSSNFDEMIKEKYEAAMTQMKLQCTQIVFSKDAETSIVSRASTSLSNCLEAAMADAEFVATKVIASCNSSHLQMLQKMIACRLYTISKMISTLAPCAASIDRNGGFMMLLCRISKRLYVTHTRFITSHSINPKHLLSVESRQLLHVLSRKMNSRVMALLLTVQEKLKVGGGKMITDSKIESHGKVSAQLVFEKERSDNALLKISTKLHSSGFETESKYLESQVAVSTSRGFQINEDKLKAIRKRNESRKRAASKKDTSKKKKKVKVKQPVDEEENMDVSGSDDDGNEDGGNMSMTMSIAAESATLEQDDTDQSDEDSESDGDQSDT